MLLTTAGLTMNWFSSSLFLSLFSILLIIFIIISCCCCCCCCCCLCQQSLGTASATVDHELVPTRLLILYRPLLPPLRLFLYSVMGWDDTGWCLCLVALNDHHSTWPQPRFSMHFLLLLFLVRFPFTKSTVALIIFILTPSELIYSCNREMRGCQSMYSTGNLICISSGNEEMRSIGSSCAAADDDADSVCAGNCPSAVYDTPHSRRAVTLIDSIRAVRLHRWFVASFIHSFILSFIVHGRY